MENISEALMRFGNLREKKGYFESIFLKWVCLRVLLGRPNINEPS
jgi:hypothetical protein